MQRSLRCIFCCYSWSMLFAMIAHTTYHYIHIMYGVAFRQVDFRYVRIFKAGGVAAFLAFEMNVMVVMVVFRAV